MNGAWNHPTLADTEDVGFYKHVDENDELVVYRVQWNRHHSARYVHWIDVDPEPRPLHRPVLTYIGRSPLDYLTPDDRLTGAQVLHYLAKHGPWQACLFCARPLREAPHSTLGVGPGCAERWFDASPRLLSTIHSAVAPRQHQRHLFLICVDGRRVA